MYGLLDMFELRIEAGISTKKTHTHIYRLGLSNTLHLELNQLHASIFAVNSPNKDNSKTLHYCGS